MLKDGIEFFNVEQIGPNGELWRFDKNLMDCLGCSRNDRARFYAQRAIGVELRFKLKGTYFDITFLSRKENTEIYVFYGDYQHKRYVLPADMETTLHIEQPEKYKELRDGAFHKDVIRIVIGYAGYVCFKGIESFGHTIEVPADWECPRETLLIYGSSISHGSECSQYIHSYAFVLSRMAKINVLNKAIPGGCQAEYIMADYLKNLKYDMAFFEFGVNVLSIYDESEYEKHLKYLIQCIQSKPFFFTSVLVNGNEYGDTALKKKIEAFRNIAEKLGLKEYIPPLEILSELSFLTTDLVHPSDFGQQVIAERLFLKMGFKK